jgi:hypothetical protein
MHAVSLTPHEQTIFRTTSKSEHHMQNSDGMQKKLKMHAVSLTPHAKYDTTCTNDSNGPGSLKSVFPNCPIPPLKNIYKFERGYLTKNFRIDTAFIIFAFEKRSYLSRIQKGFSPWIRGPGGYYLRKKPRVENLVTLSL